MTTQQRALLLAGACMTALIKLRSGASHGQMRKYAARPTLAEGAMG
jgi:hypothetical protein